MSQKQKYFFLSVPTSIAPSGHADDAVQSLQRAVNDTYGTVNPLAVPDFKVGTLDALIQHSEELSKLESLCNSVVAKVNDTLRNILDNDDSKISQHKTVNDKPLDSYLRSFTWNKVKYRSDKPLAELIDTLQKEANSIDNDVRSKFNSYNSLRTQLQTVTRKRTGNLSTKSLTSLVSPSVLVQDSEHLETHLVAIPNNSVKDFQRSYETLCPMVVPRSAYEVASDNEFALYAVTTFKKHAPDFVHKARERKWVPRDFTWREGGREEEDKEMGKVEAEEKRVWGETLRLGRTGWSEAVMALVHVLVLRVFVETVLRYGLPLDFVAVTVKVRRPLPFLSFPTPSPRFSFLSSPRSPLFNPTTDPCDTTDNAQTVQKGQGRPRRAILLPRRQRLWVGQKGPADQGRRGGQSGRHDGGRWRRRRRGRQWWVRGVRLL